MPLPPEIDIKIRKRFGDLIYEAEKLADRMQEEKLSKAERTVKTDFFSLRTKALSLLEMFITGSGSQITTFRAEIEAMDDADATQKLCGILKGLKDDYKQGMLESLIKQIEANIAADYLGQAKQLLEGTNGNCDHIPAAVLSGAVLEDALRRLCQRQTPPIDTLNPNGTPKTLGPLITDLQKAGVFNKAKGDQLMAWAKIRNYAAHGKFKEVIRTDVEAMITGISEFLAD